MTTLTLLSQVPLLGNFFSIDGNRARKTNGEAKVREKASPPSRILPGPRSDLTAVPPKPPRNGATQAKLMIVNVRAMKIVPTRPEPSRDEVYCARPLGSSISYMPNKLRAKNRN